MAKKKNLMSIPEAAAFAGRSESAIRKYIGLNAPPWYSKRTHRVDADNPEWILYASSRPHRVRNPHLYDGEDGANIKAREAKARAVLAENKAKISEIHYAKLRGELVERRIVSAACLGYLATLNRNLLESIDSQADEYISLAKLDSRPAIVQKMRDRMTRLIAESKRAVEKELRRAVASAKIEEDEDEDGDDE